MTASMHIDVECQKDSTTDGTMKNVECQKDSITDRTSKRELTVTPEDRSQRITQEKINYLQEKNLGIVNSNNFTCKNKLRSDRTKVTEYTEAKAV